MMSSNDEKVARIALFTVRSFAIEHAIPVIRDHPHAELACVLTSPGPKNRRSNAHCQVLEALYRTECHNVEVIVSNQKSKWADLLAVHNVNLILCSGFPWLLPESLLTDQRISLGVINFHNSHLPKFMGPNAFGWSMVQDYAELGYCVHRMSPQFDTGPVLFTESVPLDVNEDYQDLKRKMPAVFTKMVHKAVDMAILHEPGEPQSGTPSHAPKFDDAFRWIDFADTARQVHNKVRAFYGERDHPKGALAKIDGDILCLTKTRYYDNIHHNTTTTATTTIQLFGVPLLSSVDPDVESCTSNSTERTDSPVPSLPPGSLLTPIGGEHQSFFVQCGDSSLEVLEWHKIET